MIKNAQKNLLVKDKKTYDKNKITTEKEFILQTEKQILKEHKNAFEVLGQW